MIKNENSTTWLLGDSSRFEGERCAIERPSLGQDQLPGSCKKEQRSTRTPSTWTLFEEPYWLDCVAPGAWEAVEITRDRRVIARLPYVLKKRYGMTVLGLPPLTPYLGPWMAPSDGKYCKQLGAQHQTLCELVVQLPKSTRMLISCAPEYTNLHALASLGWSLNLMYTYRIEDTSNLDLIWKGLSSAARGRCKHARKHVQVVTGSNQLPNLIHCVSRTYQRKNFGHSYVRSIAATLERINSALGPRGQGEIFVAIDAKGRPHASLLLVFDWRHAFVSARGSDEELRVSGADSLLVWEAIRFASTRSRIFDFQGSMVPSVETNNRGFGARQVPQYSALKQPHLLTLTEDLSSRFRRFAHRTAANVDMAM